MICLGKELAGISSALSMQKKLRNSASKQQKKQKCNRKPATKAKKRDAIFVKEAKIENAVPVKRTFAGYLHGLQSLMG